MKIAQRYETSPLKWNLSILATVGVILWGAIAFYLGAELRGHNTEQTSHPTIQRAINENKQQLDSIEAGQVKAQIIQMDQRICEEPDNTFYRDELTRLITKWEKLENKTFPRELLRCA